MPLSRKDGTAAGFHRRYPYKPEPPNPSLGSCLKFRQPLRKMCRSTVQWPLAAIIFQSCLKINKNILMKICSLNFGNAIAFLL